jgi:hypothetical protein
VDDVYRALGRPGAAAEAAQQAKLRGALTDVPQRVEALGLAVGLSTARVRDLLATMDGVACHGSGKKGDPFTYCRAADSFPACALPGVKTNNESVAAESDPPGPDCSSAELAAWLEAA